MKEITVLILDEHDEVRRMLARGLESIPDFRVVAETANPVTAVELAHAWQPRLILLDFDRRGPMRSQMADWIKRADSNCSLVVFTSYFQDGEAEACRRAGAAKCLLKGMTVKELARELRDIVAADSRK